MDNGRRKLVKFLSISGFTTTALPSEWVKPVVTAVLLPVHAQSTYTAVAQIFSDSGFLNEIAGNPPLISIGSDIYFLLTTAPPLANKVLEFTKIVNDVPVGPAVEYIANGNGQVAVAIVDVGSGLFAGDLEGFSVDYLPEPYQEKNNLLRFQWQLAL